MQKAQLLTELSDMLSAGCQLERALAVLKQQAHHLQVQKVVAQIHGDIVEGSSFADAMANAGQFRQIHVAMVRAAEAGGFLQRTLRHLAEDSFLELESISKVRRSMAYPLVLLITALVSVVFLLCYVVPRFTSIYAAAGTALPLPTRVLLALSGFSTSYWWVLVAILIGAMLLGRLLLKREDVRLFWDRLILRMPLLGPLMIQWQMGQFARTMSLLLEGGLTVLQALQMTRDVLSNRVVRMQVGRLADAVQGGRGLGQQLGQSWPFSPAVAEIVRVAEQSGKLTDVFSRLSQQCYRQFASRLSTLMTLVEPAVILVVGALIGLVVAAMLLPVLLMNTLVE
jgi:type II secretory pathway component PulF